MLNTTSLDTLQKNKTLRLNQCFLFYTEESMNMSDFINAQRYNVCKNQIQLLLYFTMIYDYDITIFFTQDYLFRINQTVINESPAFVAKHLQRKPIAISSERLSSPL